MSLLHDCSNCVRAQPRDLVVGRRTIPDWHCTERRPGFPAALACPEYRARREPESQPMEIEQ
jgi:hypothetical protein